MGLVNAASLLSFRNAVAKTFGTTAGNWFVLLQASQFHVMYYASRTLPNMYAFALSMFTIDRSSGTLLIMHSESGIWSLRSGDESSAATVEALPQPDYLPHDIRRGDIPL